MDAPRGTDQLTTADRNPVPVADPPAVFVIGELLNDTFEIRDVLGAGGMGQVYEAHDRVLNRRVAIKAHWRQHDGFSIRKEAQALAAIRHPAMVTVHSCGVHRDIEYVVMERVYGVSLADHIERRRRARAKFTVAEVIDVLARIAEGLSAVHAAGIAHRDVKPGNIMLAPGGRVVLMDFGIFLPEFDVARERGAPGTAEYMAPEAITGSIAPGAAYLVDVYALGVLGYELLAGRLPYRGLSPTAILSQHLHDPVPDIGRTDVPPRLAALIRSLMAKDPNERPQSMDAVARQLRGLSPLELTPVDEAFSVLVVEDDRALAEVLQVIVADTAADATVRVVHDGDAALAAVRRNPPHLMILDLGLPGMNGMELCMYLRGTNLAEATTIIAVSAGAQAQDVQLLNQLGIRHFIRKGPDLVDRVEALVREVAALV